MADKVWVRKHLMGYCNIVVHHASLRCPDLEKEQLLTWGVQAVALICVHFSV